jgi:hypothetical protein
MNVDSPGALLRLAGDMQAGFSPACVAGNGGGS